MVCFTCVLVQIEPRLLLAYRYRCISLNFHLINITSAVYSVFFKLIGYGGSLSLKSCWHFREKSTSIDLYLGQFLLMNQGPSGNERSVGNNRVALCGSGNASRFHQVEKSLEQNNCFINLWPGFERRFPSLRQTH